MSTPPSLARPSDQDDLADLCMLVGVDCTLAEAAGIVGISLAEAERLAALPEFQRQLRQIRKVQAMPVEEQRERLVRMARFLIAGVSGRA